MKSCVVTVVLMESYSTASRRSFPVGFVSLLRTSADGVARRSQNNTRRLSLRASALDDALVKSTTIKKGIIHF
jgi:hypothetical protein